MSSSRKQLIAQIATKDRILQQQQALLLEHKRYFQHHRTNYILVLVAAVLLPSLWLGWKMKGERWVNRLILQIVDAVALAFMTYFRKQIVKLLR